MSDDASGSATAERGLKGADQQVASFEEERAGPVRAIQGFLVAARERGLIAARETESAAFAILGAVQTRAFFSHIVKQQFSDASQQRYFEELADLLLRALDAPRSPPRSSPKSKR